MKSSMTQGHKDVRSTERELEYRMGGAALEVLQPRKLRPISCCCCVVCMRVMEVGLNLKLGSVQRGGAGGSGRKISGAGVVRSRR